MLKTRRWINKSFVSLDLFHKSNLSIKMDHLPRDLQLLVVSKMDMDARIKMGIIRKLRVPEHIKDLIKSVQIPKHEVGDRYIVKFYRKRIFHMIISWGSESHIKMVALIKPNLVLDYWVANKDHTRWDNI